MGIELLFPIVGFAIGLAVLIKSSDLAVDYAVKFSNITGMSKLAIGMFVLATMTSLPEFAIAMASSFGNSSTIMFGNILGSNITDLLFVLGAGIAAFGANINLKDAEKSRQIMIATALLMLYGFVYGFNIVFGLFCLVTFWFFSQDILFSDEREDGQQKNLRVGLLILAKLIGIIAIILVAACIIIFCTDLIADAAGIKDTVIGATVIAITTTLPELAVTLSSGKKKEYEIMIGDVFGSCFVNIALIMGLSTVISAVHISITEVSLMVYLFLAYAVAFAVLKMKKVDKKYGIALLALYLMYLITMVVFS